MSLCSRQAASPCFPSFRRRGLSGLLRLAAKAEGLFANSLMGSLIELRGGFSCEGGDPDPARIDLTILNQKEDPFAKRLRLAGASPCHDAGRTSKVPDGALLFLRASGLQPVLRRRDFGVGCRFCRPLPRRVFGPHSVSQSARTGTAYSPSPKPAMLSPS